MAGNLESWNIFIPSGKQKDTENHSILQQHSKETESQKINYLPLQKNKNLRMAPIWTSKIMEWFAKVTSQ